MGFKNPDNFVYLVLFLRALLTVFAKCFIGALISDTVMKYISRIII